MVTVSEKRISSYKEVASVSETGYLRIRKDIFVSGSDNCIRKTNIFFKEVETVSQRRICSDKEVVTVSERRISFAKEVTVFVVVFNKKRRNLILRKYTFFNKQNIFMRINNVITFLE